MRVRLSEDTLEVRLAPWEKALGLLGNVRVARGDMSEVEVVRDPMRAALRSGMKAGLRLPGLYYVARSIRLDQVWAVRRGVPALSFAVANRPVLRRVVVSTPDAERLARELTGS